MPLLKSPNKIKFLITFKLVMKIGPSKKANLTRFSPVHALNSNLLPMAINK